MNNHPELKTFRRELRNHLTPAEARMWMFVNQWVFDNPQGVLDHICQQFGWKEKSGTPSAG